jgi:hypothetical protein
MVKSTIYKGIEFVRVSQLTKQELEVFNKNFNHETLIKIMIDEEVVSDCIQYKDYVLWYNSSFPSARANTDSKKKITSSHEIVEAN